MKQKKGKKKAQSTRESIKWNNGYEMAFQKDVCVVGNI